MMNLLKNTKVIGGAVIIVGLLVVVYYYWGGNSSSATVVETPSPTSQDLLITLSNLHSIRLDAAVFADPLFTSLTDFGVTIPPEPAGRRNPFAPFSASNSNSNSTSSPSGL